MVTILNSIGNFFVMLWDTIVSLVMGFGIFDLLDIAIVAFLIYKAIELFRETRAKQLVKGVIVVLIIWSLARWWNMNSVNWLIEKVADVALIAVAIIFQPEIRRALEGMGRSKLGKLGLLSTTPEEERESILAGIDAVCRSASTLQDQKVGALIVFERETGLGEIINNGTRIGADPSPSLIGNIFFPKSPLHDGAMIVRGGKVEAAGCILPLTAHSVDDKNLGTRHRAAIGMSENSDAVVVAISEETGIISIAVGGKLSRDYNSITLREELSKLLLPEEEAAKKSFFSRIRKTKGGGKK